MGRPGSYGIYEGASITDEIQEALEVYDAERDIRADEYIPLSFTEGEWFQIYTAFVFYETYVNILSRKK